MKIYISIITLLLTITMYSQNNISVSLHQDARLLVLGDDKGNDALTLNLLARIKFQGLQDRLGYFTAAPVFEIANINGNYKRYSAEIGYTFNTSIKNIEASTQLGFGFIDRWSKSFFSANANGELSYKVTDHFKVSLLAQLTERKDLKWAYKDHVIRFSGFIGLEFNLR